METELALPDNFSKLAKELNSNVLSVINSDAMIGFERAYVVATAHKKLQLALTPEYMAPIMALQGSRLGFKTDKDDKSGYPEQTVKNCLIEAVLMGVQPYGNQFNIIAGNTYITKEGFGYLLKNWAGLTYEIIPALPRIDTAKGSAAVVMRIRWMIGTAPNERDIEFAIKVNQYMGADAVIGKATRKARAWLYNTLNGFEIPEGEISDLDKPNGKGEPINKETERITLLIQDCKTIGDLATLENHVPAELKELFIVKQTELLKGGQKA